MNVTQHMRDKVSGSVHVFDEAKIEIAFKTCMNRCRAIDEHSKRVVWPNL